MILSDACSSIDSNSHFTFVLNKSSKTVVNKVISYNTDCQISIEGIILSQTFNTKLCIVHGLELVILCASHFSTIHYNHIILHQLLCPVLYLNSMQIRKELIFLAEFAFCLDRHSKTVICGSFLNFYKLA